MRPEMMSGEIKTSTSAIDLLEAMYVGFDSGNKAQEAFNAYMDEDVKSGVFYVG